MSVFGVVCACVRTRACVLCVYVCVGVDVCCVGMGAGVCCVGVCVIVCVCGWVWVFVCML